MKQDRRNTGGPSTGLRTRRRWSVTLAIVAVRAYQLLLSPFAGGACRFEPGCSAYAIEAISTHGLRRGTWLALSRVARCHPFARPGFDPVPPPLSAAEGTARLER